MPNYSAWPVLADVQAVLAAAQITASSAVNERYASLLGAATTEILNKTKRQFLTVDEIRHFDGNGSPTLEVDEFVTLHSVTSLGFNSFPTFTLSAYPVIDASLPLRQIAVQRGQTPGFMTNWVFPAGRSNVEVSALWGYAAAIPLDLWEGVASRIARSMATASFATAGRTSGNLQLVEEQFGDERKKYSKFDLSETFGSDTDWDELLRAYKRPQGRRRAKLRGEMIG